MEHNVLQNVKCRICLDDSSEIYRPFFEPTQIGFNSAIKLAEIFKNLTGIQLVKQENDPSNICGTCTNVIVNFNNLLAKFQKAEFYLNKIQEKNQMKLTNTEFIETVEIKDKKHEMEIVEHDLINTMEISCNVSISEDFSNAEDDSVDNFSGMFNNHNKPSLVNENLILPTHIEEKVIEETDTELIYESSKYTCSLCDDVYLIKKGFFAHMFQRHNLIIREDEILTTSKVVYKVPKGFCSRTPKIPSNNHQCKYCDLKCESSEALKQHLNIHKTFVCDQCGAKFLKKPYLYDHLKTHSTERKYHCKLCSKSFKSRTTLVHHGKSHGAKTQTCEICGSSFKEKSALKTHIQCKHSNEKKYACTQCDMSFKLRSILNKHVERRHSSRTERFVCSFCGMVYLNKSTLHKHIFHKHSNKEKPKFNCTICGKNYELLGTLNKHMRNVHHIVG